MTNKERLEIILDGGVPDYPPHFEIVFQLEKEIFGMDWYSLENQDFSSDVARDDAYIQFSIELNIKLIEKYDYAAIPPPSSVKGIKKTKEILGEKAIIAPHDWDGVFWMPDGKEMMVFTTKLFENPKELHKEAREKCEAAKIRLATFAEAGADLFILAYDFGYNTGPFISPRHFREFIIPYLTEIVETIHSLGKKAFLHSDGNIALLLNDIYLTGIDGYQSIDPQGMMDIKKVREQFPDWILMGNVNSGMLHFTNEKQIRESVQYCMDFGGVGKRYILSTSNCIFKGMPPASYEIMLDEYHEICNNLSKKLL